MGTSGKKVADAYYLSAEWEQLRLQALRRDGWRCQCCGAGVRGAKAGQSRPVVDHKVPRKNGGRDELANLETLCVGCHNAKTAGDKKGVGVGLSGLAVGWED